ncbi:MAG: sigma-70 family RNA polymerase sigma factor [Gemmatimonadetes bacterium]|nr:sigma-70 family RNA polymerase sigma factor [Gemmatimonadota bacterium]
MSSSPVSSGPKTSQLPDPLDQRHAAWYEEFGPAIYRYVRFHLPTADAAEDVTADTFLKAFRAGERFDATKGTAEAWLFRIAKNTVRDHLRRARIRRHVSIGQMRDLACDAPSAEERLLFEERVARLLAAVAELSEADREVISLRYGSGFDTAHVAEVLGLRESAVRTRLWRALSRLRAVMEVEP